MYNQGYLVDDQTARIFAESGVKLRQFSPPADGLVDLSLVLPSTTSPQQNSDDVREVLNSDDFVRPL